MAEHTLESIVADGLCTGCGGCAAVVASGCVRMVMDGKGFLRPIADQPLSPADQQAVRAVCPGIGLAHPSAGPAGGVVYHPVWGPVGKVGAGYAMAPDVRHRASSGGVLSALLIHLLDSQQVDFVLHVRAAADDPLRNDAVISTTRDEVIEAAGSRYAPAAPLALLPQALARQGKFAFVGKPCDVAGLRKLIALQPALADRIPVLLSFMCAGTPSLHGTHEVIERLGMPAAALVRFRYRGDGWPGLARAEAADGRVATMDYNTAWGTILNRHLQPRCKLCADGTGEFADLVCADAWYGKDGYPDFTERDGRSLVLARTPVGQRLLQNAATARAVALESFDIADLRAIQPYQFNRKTGMLARLAAIRLFGRSVPTYHRLALTQGLILRKPWQLIKEFLGTARRCAQGRF